MPACTTAPVYTTALVCTTATDLEGKPCRKTSAAGINEPSCIITTPPICVQEASAFCGAR
eukprot:7392471-Pyramimonas_sp.AAC.1